MTAENMTELAVALVKNLQEDIDQCSTREAHIRATARAAEALALLAGINQMYDTLSADD